MRGDLRDLICGDCGGVGYSCRLLVGFGLQPLANLRQGRPCSYFPGSHQSDAVFEGVIFIAVHIRFTHQTVRRFPLAAVHLLGDGETLSDDIKKMARALAVGPLAFKMHGQHAFRSHLTQRPGGYGVREHAVDEEASAKLYWQKHTWIRTTGAHRVDQRPGMEYHALASGEISCRHG